MGREPNKVRYNDIAKNIAIIQIKILTVAHYVRNIYQQNRLQNLQ